MMETITFSVFVLSYLVYFDLTRQCNEESSSTARFFIPGENDTVPKILFAQLSMHKADDKISYGLLSLI